MTPSNRKTPAAEVTTAEKEKSMNILEYINELIEQGYTEEDAARCADVMFSDTWASDED